MDTEYLTKKTKQLEEKMELIKAEMRVIQGAIKENAAKEASGKKKTYKEIFRVYSQARKSDGRWCICAADPETLGFAHYTYIGAHAEEDKEKLECMVDRLNKWFAEVSGYHADKTMRKVMESVSVVRQRNKGGKCSHGNTVSDPGMLDLRL